MNRICVGLFRAVGCWMLVCGLWFVVCGFLRVAFAVAVAVAAAHVRRFLVAHTSDTLLLADIDSNRLSEIQWNGSGNEKFYFDNPNVCMIFNAGELTLVEYGQQAPLGACRTEYMNPHLISVRLCTARRRRADDVDIKRIAYLLDLQTIRVLDLQTQQTVATITLDTKIDWLELNTRGTKLLFRDKRRALHIYDVATESRTTLINYCDYVQWVPDSDVAVAQNRNTLCVWYAIDHPEQVTLVTIKGDVEEIERTHGRTEVIVDEGISKVHYALDESLISFGTAVDDADYERAVDILDTMGSASTEANAMWSRLSTLALEDGDYRVAERCFAALGDVSKARFLHDVNQISADPRHPLVQARIAVLHKQFKRAESLLLEQGRVDDVILMYKDLHKWDEALVVAEMRGHPLAAQLRQQYFEWLSRTQQEERAGSLKEEEGDYMTAITLYLRGGHPVKAATVMMQQRLVHDAPLVERVATALLKTNQFEKAGEFFESLDRLQSALEAYSKAHSYRRAVDLSRKAFPAHVVRLEEEWGDWLASQKQWDAACNHFIEAGAYVKAIGAAIEARQWSKASQVLENVDPELARPHFKKIARHYSEIRNFRMAERYYMQGGMATEVVKMYLENSLWDEARKIADRSMNPDSIAILYEQQAQAFEAQHKYTEAERLYLDINDPDLAINMYKKLRMHDKMVALVTTHRPDLLNETHIVLARQFEHERNWKLAEQHFVAAKDWKAAVNVYREQAMWDDALRVAKAHGGPTAYKQVAYASAVTLGGEAGVKLLAKRGLAEMTVEYAIERGEFPEAFHIAEQACKHKLPDVHLQYAMSLEDAGRFDKAEEEFFKAGKPKEAVDMYIHQHEWNQALRVAETIDQQAVFNVYEAQARDESERKDYKNAESHFAMAKRPEMAIKMYKDSGLWDDAMRVAKISAPQLLHDLQTEQATYLSRGAAAPATDNPEAFAAQTKVLVKAGRYSEAVDMLLKVTKQQSADVEFLTRTWETAVSLTLEHVHSRGHEVVSVVSKRLVEVGRFDAAAQALLAVDAYREAIEAYMQGGNFAKARTVAQTSAPHLQDMVEKANQQHLLRMGGGSGSSNAYSQALAAQAQAAGGGAVSQIGGAGAYGGGAHGGFDDENSLEALAARGDWNKVYETCHAQDDMGALQRYVIMHVTRAMAASKFSEALTALVKHGAPAVAGNFPIYRRLVQEILAASAAKIMPVCFVHAFSTQRDGEG
jgi:intraflagellar transport protein 172